MYYKYNAKAPYFKACKALAVPFIRQTLVNNSYLLKKNGITFKEQQAYFKSKEILISLNTYGSLMSGRRKTCSIVYLLFFSKYWNIPLIQLMSEDMKLLDSLLDNIG